MGYSKLKRWNGLFNIVIPFFFLLWWGLMGGLTVSSGNLNITTLALVRLPGYQLQSLVGLIACILAPIGILGLYIPHAEKVGKLGLAGCLLSCLGVILYGCMQYDETFTWPILAAKAPTLLEPQGLMANPAFFGSFIFMGVLLALGLILLGIAFFRARVFPRWAVICFSAGATLFGIGMAVIFRTVGLVAWVVGWGWMGYLLWMS